MAEGSTSDRLDHSRRQFLRAAGGVMGAAVAGGGAIAAARWLGASPAAALRVPLAAAPLDPARTFRSRPGFHPASVSVAANSDADDGYLFLGPGGLGKTQAGPLIADGDGEPVWFRPLSGAWIANFRSWTYRREPVLAWWEGDVILPAGYGRGEAVLVDRDYRRRGHIRASRGLTMDMHELRITPEGTALFTCYPRVVEADLSGLGGPRAGRVFESVFQEVDISTGRLVMEWRSLDHVPVEDSYRPLADPYDYLHVNSISIAPDGNLLVSGRHTWTIYKLDRETGEVIWRLGGERSDFNLPAEARFSWQHDAEQPDEGTLTLFDNGYDGHTRSERQSRGLVLELDSRHRSARLGQALYRPRPLLSSAMGSVQVLPGGHVLVGWGSQPYLNEFASDGRIVADARLASGQQCYRTFRLPWSGEPHHRPAIRARRHPTHGTSTLYTSWNGATELAAWRVLAGPHPAELRPIGLIHRHGFETAVRLNGDTGYVAASAIDAAGRTLRTSRTVRL